MTQEEKQRKEALLSKFFTPGTPISLPDLLAGRIEQIRRIFDTITQLGQHAILYGERGAGKTSLSNIAVAVLNAQNADGQSRGFAKRVNCDKIDNFVSIWKKVFGHIVSMRTTTAGFDQEKKIIDELLGAKLNDKSGPTDIIEILRLLPNAVIVLDEFDRIEDKKTTTLFADCIKGLSDFEVPATLIIVGVANSISQLIKEHASIERSMTQIHLPRMSNTELIDIITKRFPAAEMSFEDGVPNTIARLSQGFPHYTHSLGLFAGRAALDLDRDRITYSDVRKAIDQAVKNTTASIEESYQNAVRSSHKDSLYEDVLLACAIAKHDEFGFFSAPDVRVPISKILKKQYDIPAFAGHLSKFCEKEKGGILERKGSPRRYKYRFTNPLIRPYVYLRGIKNERLPEDYFVGV